MAELADARDLKSRGSNPVPVRPRSPAPYRGVEQLVARRAHNPEVGGSSPPPATIKSLEIKRFQGFFLFSNRKVLDQASGILCTKFSRFEGQNLVQSRWVVYGMNRSSPLLCPAAILVLPDATFAGGSLFRSALLSKPSAGPNSHQKPSLGPLPCPALKAAAQRQTAGIQPVLPLCIACWFLIHFISAFYFSGLKSCRKGFVMVY